MTDDEIESIVQAFKEAMADDFQRLHDKLDRLGDHLDRINRPLAETKE